MEVNKLKKLLSILLSVVLLFTTVSCLTMQSAFAIPTGDEIADGEWISTYSNAPVENAAGDKKVTIPLSVADNDHSIYTSIKGLAANTMYTLTFDYESTVTGGTWHDSLSGILAGAPAWSNGQYVNRDLTPFLTKATPGDGSSKLTFTTGATAVDHTLVFRVRSGNGAITLSNFKLVEGDGIPVTEKVTDTMADGEWIDPYEVTQGRTVQVPTEGVVVSNEAGDKKFTTPAEIAQYNASVWTRVTLAPNTQYTFTVDYESTVTGGKPHAGMSGFIPANGATMPTFHTAYRAIDRDVNPFLVTMTFEDGKGKATFVTDDNTEYFFALRVLDGNGAITFSNFKLVEGDGIPVTEKVTDTMADGEWIDPYEVTQGRTVQVPTEGVVVSNEAGDKKFTTPAEIAQYNASVWTRVTLAPNTQYTFTVDYESTVTGGKPHAGMSGFIPANGATMPTFHTAYRAIDRDVNPFLVTMTFEDGKGKATFVTDDNTEYFFALRVLDGNGAITFSNFKLVEGDGVPVTDKISETLADGAWISKITGAPVENAAGDGAITIPQAIADNNHSIYTTIKGLDTKTTYTLTFNYTSTVAGGMWHDKLSGIVAGVPAWTNGQYVNRDLTPFLSIATPNEGTCKLTFTTGATAVDHTLVFRVVSGNGAITLSHFNLIEGNGLSAEENISAGLADGVWTNHVTNTPIENTAGDGKVTIPPIVAEKNHSVTTKLKGLETETDYILTFDYTSTVSGGMMQTSYSGIVEDPIHWDSSIGSFTDSEFLGKVVASNGKATVIFKTGAVAKDHIFVMRVLNGNGSLTLSNFKLEKYSPLSPEETIATGIADGTWYDPAQASGGPALPNTADDKQITIPQAVATANSSVYTKLSGLEKETYYCLTFKYAGGTVQSGFSGITPATGSAPSFTSAWYLDTAQSPLLGKPEADNGVYTINFTTNSTETDYFLVFRVLKGQGDITLSEFTLAKGVPPTEEEIISKNIATGTWYDPPQATGNSTFSGSAGAVTIPKAVADRNSSVYTKLSGLKVNTLYNLTFNFSGGTVQSDLSGITPAIGAAPSFTSIWYLDTAQSPLLGKPEASGDRYTITFTTNDTQTDYFLVFRVLNGQGDITLSNFSLNLGAPLTAEQELAAGIADGTWYDPAQASGGTTIANPSGDKAVTIPQAIAEKESSVYTKISGLKPNTKYSLTVDYTSTMNGGKPQTALSGLVPTNGAEKPTFHNAYWGIDRERTPFAVTPTLEEKRMVMTFTTDSNTDYFLVFRVLKGQGALTLSNFCLYLGDAPTAEELMAEGFADGEWFDPPQASGNITLPNIAGDKKVTIPQAVATANSSVYTKISNLNHDTSYTLRFKHTGGDVQLDFSGITPAINATPTFTTAWYLDTEQSPLIAKPEVDGEYYTITFLTNNVQKDYFLVFRVLNGQGDITLSDFSFVNNGKQSSSDTIADGLWMNHRTNSAIDNPVGDKKVTIPQSVSEGNHSASTTLYGLLTNSVYELTFDYESSVPDGHWQEGFSGIIQAPIQWSGPGSWAVNEFLAKATYENGKGKISFVTGPVKVDHILIFRILGGNGAITLSNFKLDMKFHSEVPFIDGYDLENTYADWLYLINDSQSFEDYSENGNLGTLPAGFKVEKDDNAFSGEKVMTVEAGSKAIFAFDATALNIYEFAASIRGGANSKGYIGVSSDANGTQFYGDMNGIIRSKIEATDDGEWLRKGFTFAAPTEGKAYIVVECTEGKIAIDNMMLFEEKFAMAWDPNEYGEYVPYDYDNPNYVDPLKGAGSVSLGGDSSDEYEDSNSGEVSDDEIASMGDTTRWDIALVILLVAAAFVVGATTLRTRKEEHYAK